MHVLSYFTVYKYIFMVALSGAQALFLFRLEKRPHFVWRSIAGIAISFLVASLLPTGSVDAGYCSFIFMVFFGLTIPLAKFCYAINWRNCLFCTVAGYTVQHIASILYNLIVTLGGFEQSTQVYSNASAQFDPLTSLIFAEVYALTYLCLYHLFGKKIRLNEQITITSPSLLGIVALMMVVEIVLNAYVVYRQYENLDLPYYICASLTNLLCSLSVLIILFGQLMRKTLEDELNVVNHMWRQERKQYQISKETIDMINIKCHDMKHQIHAIRKSETIDPKALKEVEKSIDIYDSIVKTGNEALDIILAEKGLFCQKYGITVNCIIDGEKLGFMSDMDIYSLFGNLMDNAINSTMATEPERRIISIAVKTKENLLSINFHNYFAGKVCFENGMPVTQSEDRRNHGFGVKSVTLIVARYGGNVTFNAENQVFKVNILLPLGSAGGDV